MNNEGDTITVAEAAALAGVRRQAIDQQIKRWIDTGGRRGLAVRWIGKQRVVSADDVRRIWPPKEAGNE